MLVYFLVCGKQSSTFFTFVVKAYFFLFFLLTREHVCILVTTRKPPSHYNRDSEVYIANSRLGADPFFRFQKIKMNISTNKWPLSSIFADG